METVSEPHEAPKSHDVPPAPKACGCEKYWHQPGCSHSPWEAARRADLARLREAVGQLVTTHTGTLGQVEMLAKPLTGDVGFGAVQLVSLPHLTEPEVRLEGSLEVVRRWYGSPHHLRAHPVHLEVRVQGDHLELVVRIYRTFEQQLHIARQAELKHMAPHKRQRARPTSKATIHVGLV